MDSFELQQIFSNNLKNARKRASLSQMRLAEEANLSVSYICDLESGRRWGTPETFSKLAKALKINPYELLLPTEDFSKAKDFCYQKDLLLKFNVFLKDNLNATINSAITDSLKKFINEEF